MADEATTQDDAKPEAADEAKPDEASDAKDDTTTADEPDKPEASAEDTTTEPEADAEVPAIPDFEPELVSLLDESAIRELFASLEAARAPRAERAVTDAEADEAEAIAYCQALLAEELDRQVAEATKVAERIDQIRKAEPVKLTDAKVPQPVAAAVTAAAKATGKADTVKPTESDTERQRARASWQASAGVMPPSDTTGLADIAGASYQYARSMMQPGKVYLASLPGFDAMRAAGADLPEPLTRGNIERNDELIRESVDAFVARGLLRDGADDPDGALARQAAICDPLDVLRDIPDSFTDEERFSPTFPSRPIGHLGFTFTRSAVLSDVAGGANVWDESDQASVTDTSSTWKALVDFDCGTPVEAVAEAITYGARYDITLEMSSPERLQNLKNALSALRARTKEAELLRIFDTLVGRNLWSMPVGAVPNFLEMLATLVAQSSDHNRLSDPQFTVALPPGFMAPLIGDVVKRGSVESLNAAGEIRSAIQAIDGVANVVELLDGTGAGIGQPGYPLPTPRAASDAPGYLAELNQTFRVRVYDPRGYIYAETGEINAGVYRSTEEVRRNQAVLFGEEFVILDKHGPRADQYVDISLCGSGRRATGYDPGDCTSADAS